MKEIRCGHSQIPDAPEGQPDRTRDSHGITRRSFIHSATAIAGAGFLLKDGFMAQFLDAEPVMFNGVLSRTPERIAATPTFKYRPYRSKPVSDAETTSWVQIDLGQGRFIDEIRLFPANQRKVPGQDAFYVGEAFPVRFKVESANEPDFIRPQMLLDHTGKDYENPKDSIVSISSLQGESRYLRLTVTKFPAPKWTGSVADAPEIAPPLSARGQHWFALSRITVLTEGRDVALGCHVSGDTNYSNPEDLQQLTRQPRIETEYVYRNRPELITDPATWNRVTFAAESPRTGVALHGGLFETTMRNNITYLLESFTVNDLLLQFRERAGKPIPPSSHVPNQFWETDLAGSNAGRFLMGAGNTLRWIDDPQLRASFNAVLEGIAECREPSGYIMAYPQDTIFFSERGGYTRAWLTHGLVEAGYAGSSLAFELLRGYYDWFDQCEYLPNLMRGAVQGGQGMIANTRTYLTPVGKPADIQALQRCFVEEDWLAALATMDEEQIWQYPYDRPHCYLLTNLEAYLDLYLATGDKRYYDGVRAAWNMFHEHWEQTGGSISIIEYSYDPPGSNSLTQKLGEFCGSSFWILLSQRFHLLAPDEERYVAEIEKSIYNVALAHQDGSYGIRYHTILVGYKEKATRINTCCEGQGTRTYGSLPEHIYSLANDGVYVNLYEPSGITWNVGNESVSMKMETRFPYDNKVKLTVTPARTMKMRLRIRVPSWATRRMDVLVNGAIAVVGDPGSYVVLERVWSIGDEITFELPIGFSLAEYKGVSQIPGKKRYSLTYGPILYAAVGPKDAILTVTQGVSPEDLIHQLRPKPDAPLHFAVTDNEGTLYMPYWQVGDEQEFTCFPVVETDERG